MLIVVNKKVTIFPMKEFKFVLSGETPAKKNSRIINTKTGISFPSVRYTQWRQKAIAETLKQVPIRNINSECIVELNFIHGDLRRRDSDNGCSSIMDMLTDCGVLSDDNWQIVNQIIIHNGYEKNNARCEVKILIGE